MADKSKPAIPAINPDNLYLYLLVRSDMASLGRGKSVAQGAHAANEFTELHVIRPLLEGKPIDEEVQAWRTAANGFGTTIALDATLQTARQAIQFATWAGFKCSFTVDPSYPLLDGGFLHILPDVPTVGWIFGDKEKLRPILQRFNLLENDPVPVKERIR